GFYRMIFTHILLAAGLASTAPSPITVDNCQFGEVHAFDSTECIFHVHNSSTHPISIDIKAGQPEDSATPSATDVSPGATVNVTAHIAIGNGVGDVKHYFRIGRADGDARAVYAYADGFALSALDQFLPNLAFGNVNIASEAPERDIKLSSRDNADFRILRITGMPDAVDATIAPDGRTLHVRIRKDAPWAVLDDYIKLAINTPYQKKGWVRVTGDIHGAVAPKKNPVSLGFVAPGKDRQVAFDLTHAEGKSFRVGSMTLDGFKGRATTRDCEPAKLGCKSVVLHIADDQRPGIMRGTLTIVPDTGRSLAVKVWAILQAPQPAEAAQREAKKILPDASKKNANASTQPPRAAIANANDVSGDSLHPKHVAALAGGSSTKSGASPAIKHEPALMEPPPPGTGPLLKWSTTDEGGVHGYQIYRSDSADGPFVLQNRKTIRAHPDKGSDYQWRDTHVEHGKAYWYYIGVVYKNGRKDKLSSPQRTVAK
ncbi:MAG: hypothetical protein WBW61_08885, partial [Rhodanobacteraceae bacterium]